MRTVVLCCVAALLAVEPVKVTADLLPIDNPGFEVDMFVNGGSGAFITDWTSPNSVGVFNPTTAQYPGEAPEGQNVAWINLGTASQVLADTLQPNTDYELTLWVGNRLDAGFPGYSVQLLAGGTVLAQDGGMLSPAAGTFLQASVPYSAGATDSLLGQSLEIRFSAPGVQVNFDDVQLSATVIPEPGTALLLLTALPILACARMRT